MPTATPVRPSLTVSQHAHHWVIAEPDGPQSVGHCRICAEQRSSSNAGPAPAWTRDVEERSDILGFRRQLARRPSAFQLSDETVVGPCVCLGRRAVAPSQQMSAGAQATDRVPDRPRERGG